MTAAGRCAIVCLVASAAILRGASPESREIPYLREGPRESREIPYDVAGIEEGKRLQKIRDTMDLVRFQSLDFSSSNLIDALTVLREGSHSDQGGFSFVLLPTPEEPLDEKAPLNLILPNSSLPEVLDAICKKIGCYWSCEGKIVIAPAGRFTKAQMASLRRSNDAATVSVDRRMWMSEVFVNALGRRRSIVSTDRNGVTFEEALDKLPSDGSSPDGIPLGTTWWTDDKLQAELLDILKHDVPELLEPALKSAGNMHNPRVTPLSEPAEKALLQTSLCRDINRILGKRNRTIHYASFEKFSIYREDGKIEFFGIAALSVAPKDVVDFTDPALFRYSEAVIRARVLAPRGARDKYCSVPVETLSTFKAPAGVTIPRKLNISYLSIAPELPIGESTLYLVYYNPKKPELGWKLLPGIPPSTQPGFSHHVAK